MISGVTSNMTNRFHFVADCNNADYLPNWQPIFSCCQMQSYYIVYGRWNFILLPIASTCIVSQLVTYLFLLPSALLLHVYGQWTTLLLPIATMLITCIIGWRLTVLYYVIGNQFSVATTLCLCMCACVYVHACMHV